MDLQQDIRYLKGVGEKRAACYARLGVHTLHDLIRLYPRAYQDFSHPVPIAETALDEVCVVKARVYRKQPEQRIRAKLTVYKLFVTDDESNLTITIFNSKYLYDSLRLGQTYYFYGKVTGNLLRREMQSPTVLPADAEARILPIYPLTQGLNSRMVADNVRTVLLQMQDDLSDPIPDAVRREYRLCHLSFALQNIHFPKTDDALAEARRRLIFEELLTLQTGLLRLRNRNRKATAIRLTDTDLSDFYARLPFTLTGAQQRAIGEAVADLTGGVPMNRLVQGDVGSGKTMVAAALGWLCAKNGLQTAVMAPTEILAAQHFDTFSKLFADSGVRVCLLTGAATPKQKREIRAEIESGAVDLIVGTHALVQKTVQFHKLGLVVTDEQHRFGVAERASLAEKGENPHLLVMSATPIPRTLALAVYGDLDVSVIDELPRGRQTVRTLVIHGEKRERAFGFIRERIAAGEQAYIVCPLIEESESELKDVTGYYRRIRDGAFRSIPTGLLHGQLKADEKERTMQAFKAGELRLLVTTTVIEVGVDVPNATVMLIENAERFGLSQLHQLRGRVGRGDKQAYCILLSDNRAADANARLKIMAKYADGFQIAEEDLKLRGPGDFFGQRQHGLPKLKIADMVQDAQVLRQTRRVAQNLLKADPDLSAVEHRGIKRLIDSLFESDTTFN